MFAVDIEEAEGVLGGEAGGEGGPGHLCLGVVRGAGGAVVDLVDGAAEADLLPLVSPGVDDRFRSQFGLAVVVLIAGEEGHHFVAFINGQVEQLVASFDDAFRCRPAGDPGTDVVVAVVPHVVADVGAVGEERRVDGDEDVVDVVIFFKFLQHFLQPVQLPVHDITVGIPSHIGDHLAAGGVPVIGVQTDHGHVVPGVPEDGFSIRGEILLLRVGIVYGTVFACRTVLWQDKCFGEGVGGALGGVGEPGDAETEIMYRIAEGAHHRLVVALAHHHREVMGKRLDGVFEVLILQHLLVRIGAVPADQVAGELQEGHLLRG